MSGDVAAADAHNPTTESSMLTVPAEAFARILARDDPDGFMSRDLGVIWVDDGTGTASRLVNIATLGCFIRGCDNDDIDTRGPVWLRDGTEHQACTEHWEPIFRVLGEQATWEATDAYTTEPTP